MCACVGVYANDEGSSSSVQVGAGHIANSISDDISTIFTKTTRCTLCEVLLGGRGIHLAIITDRPRRIEKQALDSGTMVLQ